MAEPEAPEAPEALEESESGETLTIGERELLEGYADFRKELEALPSAAQFQALVLKYGQMFGYRAVGRWIVGRAPKPKAKR